MRDLLQEFEDSLIVSGYSPEMAETIRKQLEATTKNEGK